MINISSRLRNVTCILYLACTLRNVTCVLYLAYASSGPQTCKIIFALLIGKLQTFLWEIRGRRSLFVEKFIEGGII